MHKRIYSANSCIPQRAFVGITIGLIGITAISANICNSIRVNADDVTDVVDSVNLTIPVSCTFGSGGGTYNDTMAGGTVKEITANAITTSCNDTSGYAIYAIGFSNNKYTSDTTGNNNDMITSLGSSHNITTSSNNTYGSNWKMKLTSPTDATIATGYDSYTAIPSTYTKVASYNTNTTGGSITPKYQITTGSSQPAGTYTGKVKYTLVHPSTEVPLQPQTTTAGQICYYPNGNGVVGSMGCQTVSTSATSATLLASNFSREGYGFAGWSTTFDYSDSTGFLGPQEEITFTAGTYTGSNPGLSLYARWIKSAGNLQGWSGCSSLASGAVTALTDQRDNDTYAVAKLADGNCWMIENLRLDNTNSDNSTGTLSQGYATGFIGLADPESPWAYDSTTANSLYSTDGSTSVTISGSNPYYRMPRYNNVNTPSSASDRPSNPTSNSATNSTSNAGMYSYGNYYTWTAASTDISETSTGNYNTKSICPTSWSIPRGGNKSREATNDFWTYIVTNLNGGTNPANYDSQSAPYYTDTTEAGPVANALRAYPNNFVYSGYTSDNGSVNGRGTGGNFWSSTASSIISTYSLYVTSSIVGPGVSSNYKSNGRSVRCITTGA